MYCPAVSVTIMQQAVRYTTHQIKTSHPNNTQEIHKKNTLLQSSYYYKWLIINIIIVIFQHHHHHHYYQDNLVPDSPQPMQPNFVAGHLARSQEGAN